MIKYHGIGWRLEKDISRKDFVVLIGGENFAFELTKNEWDSLKIIVSKLIHEYESLEAQLMKEEKIYLEMDLSPWWVCIDGDKGGWSLKLLLSCEGIDQRGFEAFWPMPIGKEIALQMRSM